MKAILRIVVVSLAVCASAGAQSAEEVIKRHVKAAGGEKRLKGIVTSRYEGTVSINGSAPRPFTWLMQRPDRLYIESQSETGPVIEAYNGRSGWRDDPAGGVRTLTGREQARSRAMALFLNDRFQNYKKEKIKVGPAGEDTVSGRAVYVVQMTNPAGVQRKLYFDRQNYALLKEWHERDDGAEEIYFRDFRPLNGVLEPRRIEWRREGAVFEVALNEIAHNSLVNVSTFDFPRRAQAALPDIAALLREVEKNQETVEKLRENYTYNLTETSLEVDNKGKLKQKEEKTYEIVHLGSGWTLRKLIAENGRKLAPDDERKEQKKAIEYIEKFEKWKKEEPQRKSKEEKEKAKRAAQGKPEEDDDDLEVSDFLRITQLSNPRRERFRGQDVLVFEFSPRAGYKPRNRAESLVSKLAGVVWIAENEKQVARLEARMLENMRMGGGLLASFHRGSAAVFEQEMVKGEVWLPRYAELNFSARVMLLAGVKVNRVLRFDHYQRFNVESISEIKAPQASSPPQ